MFAKLDSGIIHSSIWSDPYPARILWITMLAMKDETGFVATSRTGLIRAANISPEEFSSAIKVLESPDDDSRTKDFDGRRVEQIEGGWVILNHDKYRLHDEKKKEYHREYMRDWRSKKEGGCEFTNNHSKKSDVTMSSPSVSVSVSESVSKKRDCKGKTRFTPPTIEEVTEYCKERNNNIDPQVFIDFYASKGWIVGKAKMRDWKACVRTWEKRSTPTTTPKGPGMWQPPKNRPSVSDGGL